jgi:hypothetical protein
MRRRRPRRLREPPLAMALCVSGSYRMACAECFTAEAQRTQRKIPFTGSRKPKTAFDMEIKTLDFLVGASVGAILGVGLTLAIRSIRGWLGYSEVSRLRSEVRSLKRRLGEKDRHIARMLTETERLAERLQEVKVLEQLEKNVLD